jgi:hypothetical protein
MVQALNDPLFTELEKKPLHPDVGKELVEYVNDFFLVTFVMLVDACTTAE